MEAYIRHGGLPPSYQCDLVVNKTYDEWLEEGEVHIGLGIVTLIYGLVGVVLYIPCCRVLLDADLWNITAYKLLFIVSVYQTISLLQNSVLAGIFFILGIVYCNYPTLNYIVGSTVMMAWSGVCCSCFVLGLSRLVDLFKTEWHDLLFEGKRVYFSVVVIFMYSTTLLFYANPTVFNSRELAWGFDPMVYPDGSHFKDYACVIQVLNNEGVVSLTALLTLIFVATFIYKSYFFNFKMTTLQKTLFIQTCVSSLNTLASATIYVSYGFIDGGLVLNYLGLLTWQLSSSGELIMFLFLNATVRERVFQLFGFKNQKVYTLNSQTLQRTSQCDRDRAFA